MLQGKSSRAGLLPLISILLLTANACGLAPQGVALPSATPAVPSPMVPPASPTAAAPVATPTPTSIPLTGTPAPPTAFPTPAYPLGPGNFASNMDPLTGLAVGNPQQLDLRPLAVVVSNFPRSARPQAGLSQADLVFEAYTEAGSSRFLALYYGALADKVGPIRSARLEAIRIAPLYDAILVHAEAYQEIWDQLYAAQVDAINEYPAGCPAICRDPNEKESVNSVFGNISALETFAQKVNMESGRPDLEGMVFDPAPPGGGSPAQGARIQFSSAALAQWQYDPGSGTYLRSSESDWGTFVALDDRTTGQQISAANVLVLYVPFSYFVGGPTTAELWDINLGGSGAAVFFRDGLAVPGTWKRAGGAQPLQFFGASGQPFALKPGRTWIELIGRTSLTVPMPSQWQFTMRFP